MMLTLANALADVGERVDLVVGSSRGPFRAHLSDNVRLVDLQSGRMGLSIVALIRYLRHERPAAFVSSLNHANVISVIARSLSGVRTRLIVCVHNTVSRSASRRWRDKALPALMRMTYPWADQIVAVSHGVADDLARHLKLDRQLIEVIYNPVVTPSLKEAAEESVEHPWLSADAPPVVIGVGRLTSQKGFDFLIRAFARLRERRDARLVILGEGELRNDLETLVDELGLDKYVSLPGFVSNPYASLRQATVFVLSSRSEGLPTVLIEAMACGTSVIATDCPSGPREILEKGKWGRLVPVGDVPALALAIEATLSDLNHPSVAVRAMEFDVACAVERYRKVMGL